MPLTHEHLLQVRHYECDLYGHVNHANYIRYMQEAAFAASAAAGYDMQRYRDLGTFWLIRETNVTYERPLVFGDTIVVTTWVGSFRRVRSRRMYEIRLAGSGELAARGYSDWVYLNSQTSRPVTIPPAMIAAFQPEFASAPPDHRERFPDLPSPPADVFTVQRRVAWSELDPAQHVNNANYLTYYEDCSVQAAATHGWTVARMMEHYFGIIARQYRIEYRQPAFLDDELVISTWVSDVKQASALRHYSMSRRGDGELLSRATARWVWIDLRTGRPKRIPAEFLADFAPNLTPEN